MHHHNIIDNLERTGAFIGVGISATVVFFKRVLLYTAFGFDINIHNTIQEIIESCIIAIPTAAIGGIIGYYITKLLKKIDKK